MKHVGSESYSCSLSHFYLEDGSDTFLGNNGMTLQCPNLEHN
jgi:hypothetical protein